MKNVRFSSLGKSALNIVFFGTDRFAIPSLKALSKHLSKTSTDEQLINNLAVVTPPDAPSGRSLKIFKPAPIKIEAERIGLEVYHPSSKKLDDWNLPGSENYDLAIAVSFGAFIPERILSRFSLGGINIHPSLLPQYRGPAPIIHSLFNGDATTGVTIQEISPKAFDAGRILIQKKISLEFEDYLVVHDRLADLGASMLDETLLNWDSFKSKSWEQDLSRVSKAPKLDRSYSFINWEFDSPDFIMRKNRALSWRYPIITYFRGQPTMLYKVEMAVVHGRLTSGNFTPAPGTIFYSGIKDTILVQTSSPYHVLSILDLRVGSRERISAKDFLKGYQFASGQEAFTTVQKSNKSISI